VAPESLGLTLPHEPFFVDLRFLYREINSISPTRIARSW
jgi:hypothetical protein